MDELRILLVEDNPGDARLFRELLRNIGELRCEVSIIDHLSAITPATEQGRFDVLLLDLFLPDAQGLATLRGAMDRAPGVPIVVLTGMSDGNVAIQALREGAQDYLVKGGFDGAALGRAIRYAVERGRLERELRFLANAGELLASDLDYESTLQQMARLSVPTIADWCVIDILEEDGALHGGQLAAADPEKEQLLRGLPVLLPQPVQTVLVSREPILVPDVDSDFLARSAVDADHLRVLQVLEPRSAVFVPLTLHDQVLGAVTLVTSESGRRFTPHDVWMAGELARRAALSIENGRLYRRARAATRAREEVLAVVAHDLRNPLSAVSMIASLLMETELSPDQARDQLRAVLRTTEQMDRLVADLLDAARIDAGTLAVNAAVVSVDEPVRDALQQVEAAAGERRVRLDVDLEPTLPAVWADHARLVQVLSNLLGNAIRHSPLSATVTVRGACVGREVVLSVADGGEGIAPEDMPHIFERFWQADPGADVGAGLGLSIARGVVEAHGGRIWASSTPGEGATFSFTVPRADEPRGGQEPPGESAGLPSALPHPPSEPATGKLEAKGSMAAGTGNRRFDTRGRVACSLSRAKCAMGTFPSPCAAPRSSRGQGVIG